jgi:drug/metabolite transporter (DMT)-like permease
MLYTLIVSICTSFLAFAMLQLGIRELGATTAALFCLLEPITSILSGVRLLGEEMTFRKAAGCLLVLGAVVLTLLSGNDRHKAKKTSRRQSR